MPKKKITIDDLAGMVHKGFLSMDKKNDKQFKLVDKHFEILEKEMNKRFDVLERRLDRVIVNHEKRIVSLEGELTEFKQILHIANF